MDWSKLLHISVCAIRLLIFLTPSEKNASFRGKPVLLHNMSTPGDGLALPGYSPHIITSFPAMWESIQGGAQGQGTVLGLIGIRVGDELGEALAVFNCSLLGLH